MTYYNDDTIVYYNNEFLKAADVKGNVYDQSLHYGYAVFEGIRAYSTPSGIKIFKAREHYERMQASCEAVGIPYPFDNDELIDITYQVLEKNNLADANKTVDESAFTLTYRWMLRTYLPAVA